MKTRTSGWFAIGLTTLLCGAHAVPAQTWTPTPAPAEFWRSVACSSDGTKIFAAGDGGIFGSLDGGLTWLFLNATGSDSVVCSIDGTKLAASGPGGVYTSPDSGAMWNFHPLTTNDQYYLASSANGTNLVAVGYGGVSGSIYTSSDAGNTWASNSTPADVVSANVWSAAASSADGTKLVAAAESSRSNGLLLPGPIYTSTNSGAAWMPSSAPSNVWYSVASSADGTRLVAAAYAGPSQVGGTGLVYTSDDSGNTWTPAMPPSNFWNSVAISADGMNVVAVSLFNQSPGTPGVIWRSTNSGVNWYQDTLTGYFSSAAISSDGSRLVAADLVLNRIYTLGEPGATAPSALPVLSIAPTENQLRLTWAISNAAGFTLAAATNLAPPVPWVPLTNVPTLGADQITVTLSNLYQNQFFRLMQQ